MVILMDGFGWTLVAAFIVLPFILLQDARRSRKAKRRKEAIEEITYVAHGRLAYLSQAEKAGFDLVAFVDKTASLYKDEISRVEVERIVLDAARETGVLDCKAPSVLADADAWLRPNLRSVPFEECGKIAARRGLPPSAVRGIVWKRLEQIQRDS